MEIFKNFGINPYLMIAQIVNFLIILFVLKKLLYKPIMEVLKNRELAIKEGLRQAEEARVLLEKTAQKEKEVLKQAQEESRKLLDETKKQANIIIQEAEESAKKHSQRILEESRRQITFEAKEAQKALSVHISGLAVEFLQKSVGELFSKDDQEAIIQNALEKMKKRVD